ncbi:3-phosphoshikimate 1-carboxyvinyltransferase [bacterium BMS3Bbin10]|nr:3-phosphoshikimate 1-carboxyvinyltransferase [bacterium BMS3Bbin10]
MLQKLSSSKSGSLRGISRVPGDKSISHRALIFGALATGKTRIKGLLEAEDVLATGKALASLGAGVERDPDGWCVTGRGIGGLTGAPGKLDFGNSGTGARLMMGVIAGQDARVTFTGDESLSRRPMGRVLLPLQRMGLGVEGADDTLPLTLTGTPDLLPIEYELPVPSAQVKSAVLLAGLHAPGKTTIFEREATRDHTERMLRHFGAQIAVRQDGSRNAITVTGDAELAGQDVTVPGDPSSAAFLAAAALVTQGSRITIEGVLVNPTRTGFYDTLKEMGAKLDFTNLREEGGEPVADIAVTSGPLHGVVVPASRAPSMIDEYPVLAVVAAFARGETRMEGLGELRVKESDRLASTLAGLAACGVDAQAGDDWLSVRGGGPIAGGAQIETHMDHRIAMAFLIMGLGARAPVTIDNAGIIATSFPEFSELMRGLGAPIETSKV